MSALLWLDRETCSKVALVLWQVTWSGMLLCTFALLAMRWFARAAQVRYALSCATLLGTLLLIPMWAVIGARASGVAAKAASSGDAAPLQPAASPIPESPLPSIPGLTAEAAAVTPDSTVASRLTSAEPAAAAGPRASTGSSPGSRDAWVQGVTLAYAFGLLAMLVRLVAGVWGGERLRSAGRPVENSTVLSLLADQARQLGLRVAPALRTCERVAVPVVVGLLRPVILIPTAMLTGLSQDQLSAILAHELAHLRRHDHLVLLGQRIIETLLFFHPAVWYLSRQIDESREECCDDLVLAHGTDSLEYARSLLRVAELRIESRATSALPALSALSVEGATPSVLRRRISRLLGLGTAPVMRLTRTGLLVLLGSLAGLLSLSLVIAGSEGTTKSDDPIVRFEDGVELELVGLAQHPSDGKPWWRPDGSPLATRPAEKFGGQFYNLTPEEAAGCREIWAVVRGATSAVQSHVVVEGATHGAITSTTYDNDRRLYTIHHGRGPVPERTSTRIQIGLSLVDDLPLRTFDVSGKKTVPDEAQLPPGVRALDDLVRCLEVREQGDMVELAIAPLGPLWGKASIEFLAEGPKGFDVRSHESTSREGETVYTFKIQRTDATRIAYRLRPYTHWATFEDVSLEPGRKTELRAEGTIDRSVDVNAPTPPAEQIEVLKQLQKQGVLFQALGPKDGNPLPLSVPSLGSRVTAVIRCDLVGPTASSMRLLSRLSDLEELQIMGCRTREGLEEIGRLRKLKRLELINCQWTAADFAILSKLPHLESLKTDMHYQLSLGTDWYKEQIPHLSPEQAAFIEHRLKLSGNPSVTEMCCYDAFLTDEGLRVLDFLPNLRHLELTNAYITDASFRRITAHPELQTLRIGGGFLTEAGLRTIANCRKLESIDVGWGPWSAAALADLEKTSSLREIRLWHPSIRVSPASLAQLQNALPEAKVVLRQHPEVPPLAVPPLEFRLVANEPDSELEPKVPADWKTKRFRKNSAERTAEETPGFAWFPIRSPGSENIRIPIVDDKRRALLSDQPEHMLAGDGSWSVEEAKVENGPSGDPTIGVRLDKTGGEQLSKLTGSHLKARLAIVVDGTIVMAPTINSTIGDRLEITGKFSMEEANELVTALLKGKKDDHAEKPDAVQLKPGTIPERLEGTVELAASDQPLIHVLSDLEARYGVPITMDLRAFQTRGVSPQIPVTLQMSGVSLRNTLRVVLETADPSLNFDVTDKGILIPGSNKATSNDSPIGSRGTAEPAAGSVASLSPSGAGDRPSSENPSRSKVVADNKSITPMILVDIEAPEAEVPRIVEELAPLESERVLIRVRVGETRTARIAAAPKVTFAELNTVIEKLKRMGLPPQSIVELKAEPDAAARQSSVTWIRQGSVRSGGGEPRTELSIGQDGWAAVPGDHRTRESRLRLAPAEVDALIAKLWDECHLPEVSGQYFNGQPDFWNGSQDTIEIHHAGKHLTLSCQYGWPSDSRDGHIENFLKALRVLGETKRFVAAGGNETLSRVLPLVNDGLKTLHPNVPPLSLVDFMGAENYPGGSREITFYRERHIAGQPEKLRAAIEVPDEGEPNLLSIELNGRKIRTERPPQIPGIDLTGVPIQGTWHDITDVYEQRPNEPGETGRFFRVRPGIRTIDIGQNLEAHILPGGKSFYIEHADHVRRNVYGPIEGNVERMLKPAVSK